jgi:DNA-binding NtrC family response regulator
MYSRNKEQRSGGKILVVDDEASITGALEIIFAEQGHAIKTVETIAAAMELLHNSRFDLVFTDLRFPQASGMDLLAYIKNERLDTEVILMTAHGSLDITVDAIKQGAYYYLEKPFTPEQALMLTERALQFIKTKQENRSLRRQLTADSEVFGMIGRSPKMLKIFDVIRATAASDASVLIEGASGTGKELISTAFHLQSQRADHPFIHINCAAIPRDLIESELFGYKKGAFTGANQDKRGLLEATRGGTLLLDEIAEMPLYLQTKLLRVLQERKLRRLGDEREIEVDFRLISATNRDMSPATRQEFLREDLYFRISTIKIKVPPLRERLDDLALLAERFVQRYSEKYKKGVVGIAPSALSLLMRYNWPGNVRELESVIESAVLFCQETQLTIANLPDHLQANQPEQFACLIPPHLTMEEIEREALRQTLDRTGGNIKKAARILNLHRPTLYRKLKKFGLYDGVEVEANPSQDDALASTAESR